MRHTRNTGTDDFMSTVIVIGFMLLVFACFLHYFTYYQQ